VNTPNKRCLKVAILCALKADDILRVVPQVRAIIGGVF
jgi:hypothetical protein